MDKFNENESPKKGPTLSTSTSSFEALDPHDPNLSCLASMMFQKTEDYLYGEFTSTQDAYKKLEEMNRLTLSKYSDIHRITRNLSTNVVQLNGINESLDLYIEKIDSLAVSVAQLEKMARAIEAYTKNLEARFKLVCK